MLTLDVNDQYSLELAPEKSGVRLTLMKAGEQQVCRKATRKELQEFSKHKTTTAFKGRLQLHKHQGKIKIEAKKEIVGSIPVKLFEAAISEILLCSVA
ncbi:hypothetical protein [Gimesia fumaroli]|uniref:Uncharacterized protein n=1 Tax=Gimesia fumaroli TaxID=2527976 RepID=A0A518ILL1_9PLAN|nr:hypothetical protein [Gimesia fumaroli]QDV53986.1 hypothetical protein Enr17x_60690 [Gimesia fumaroli]